MGRFVLTAPGGRSGTSLLDRLLHEHLANVVCFNEFASASVKRMRQFFDAAEAAIRDGKHIPVKVNRDGERTTNPWRDGARMELQPLDKEVDDPHLIHKGIMGCVDEIPAYLAEGWGVIVIVRDPAYSVAAWGVPEHKDQHVYRVADDDLHRWWTPDRVCWTREDPDERRAEFWEAKVRDVLEARDRQVRGSRHQLYVLTYEALVADPLLELRALGAMLDADVVGEPDGVFDGNTPERYPHADIDRLQQIARELCPTRRRLGYV